jgi:hypothetical protein
MTLKLPNGLKMYQVTIKYASIFHSNALPNIPKLVFLVRKCMFHLATLDSGFRLPLVGKKAGEKEPSDASNGGTFKNAVLFVSHD